MGEIMRGELDGSAHRSVSFLYNATVRRGDDPRLRRGHGGARGAPCARLATWSWTSSAPVATARTPSTSPRPRVWSRPPPSRSTGNRAASLGARLRRRCSKRLASQLEQTPQRSPSRSTGSVRLHVFARGSSPGDGVSAAQVWKSWDTHCFQILGRCLTGGRPRPACSGRLHGRSSPWTVHAETLAQPARRGLPPSSRRTVDLDEPPLMGPFLIVEVSKMWVVTETELDPRTLGFYPTDPSALRGGWGRPTTPSRTASGARGRARRQARRRATQRGRSGCRCRARKTTWGRRARPCRPRLSDSGAAAARLRNCEHFREAKMLRHRKRPTIRALDRCFLWFRCSRARRVVHLSESRPKVGTPNG